MSLRDRVKELAALTNAPGRAPSPPSGQPSSQPPDQSPSQSVGEMRAQYLAATYRQALLDNTPDDLSQLHFLCILAATLGRFVRDAAKPGESENLTQLLAVLMQRHAGLPPLAES